MTRAMDDGHKRSSNTQALLFQVDVLTSCAMDDGHKRSLRRVAEPLVAAAAAAAVVTETTKAAGKKQKERKPNP